MAGRRVDLVRENVFRVSSRISSTWGGNLVDMVRATRIFDIIERDSLISAAASNGAQLLNMLTELAVRHPSQVSNPRGRGLMAAFDLPDASVRDLVVGRLLSDQCVLILPTGHRGIRFRPPLTVSAQELAQAVAAIDVVLREVAQVSAHESGA